MTNYYEGTYIVMSTATDQLKLRKIIPMKTMMKLTRIMFLAIMTPQISMGRLMRRLPPQMIGSIHWNLGLSQTDIPMPAKELIIIFGLLSYMMSLS